MWSDHCDFNDEDEEYLNFISGLEEEYSNDVNELDGVQSTPKGGDNNQCQESQ